MYSILSLKPVKQFQFCNVIFNQVKCWGLVFLLREFKYIIQIDMQKSVAFISSFCFLSITLNHTPGYACSLYFNIAYHPLATVNGLTSPTLFALGFSFG